MRTRIVRATAVAAFSTIALTGCVASPFGDVFADEPAAPAAPVAPAAPAQNDAPNEPGESAAQVTALDLTAVVRQANEILAPVLAECVTGVTDTVSKTATSDSRVTCSGQFGPLASDLSGGMAGRTITVDELGVGEYPGVKLLEFYDGYRTLTSGTAAVVPVESAGAWTVTQSAVGTSDQPMLSSFDVTDEITAEVAFTADVTVDATGTVTTIAVTGSTATSSVPKANY